MINFELKYIMEADLNMNSFLLLMEKGGFTMIPIFLCSLIALTIIIERMFTLRRSKVIPSVLLYMLQNFTKNNVKPILDYCTGHKNTFSSIVKTLIMNMHLTNEETAEIIKITGRQETSSLDRGLFMLELIANVAPLLGLLGTVLGMIDIFDIISRGSMGQAEALSAGIAKALITTVAGLVVGIPSLAAYTLFSRKLDRLISEMDKQITYLHSRIYDIRIE